MVQIRYYPCKKDDIVYDGACHIVEEERKHIQRWRGRIPHWGLALSGGGIRSASYSLGVLQALANAGWLRHFDYLSTVSGGGYTGVSLSYLLYQSSRAQTNEDGTAWPKFDATRENFPYLSNPMVDAPLVDDARTTRSKGGLLRHLRQNAKYLQPGKDITLLSLFGTILRNGLMSLIVHFAFLVVLLQTVFFNYDHHTLAPSDISSSWVLIASACAFSMFGVMSTVYALASSRFEHVPDRSSYSLRRFSDVATNWLFVLGLLALTIGVLPFVDEYLSRPLAGTQLPNWLAWLIPKDLHNLPPAVGVIAALLGALGNFWGFLQIRSAKKLKIPTAPLIAVASSVLLFGALLIAFHLVAAGFFLPPIFGLHAPIWAAALVVFVLFGLVPDVNYVSIHRYYRDRLMETFMPDLGISAPDSEERTGRSDAGNETPLGRICGANTGDDVDLSIGATLARGPYHIINANVVLVSSDNARYRGRGGDSFILSPLFTGSRATGWERTDPSQENGVSLATAMAISGAAVSPNAGTGGAGVTRQPVLSVLMSLFNLRMGYWLANPNPASWKLCFKRSRARSHPNLIFPGLSESFGRRNLKESSRYVLLTDGGHFENLGLYELVRRRLKLILVCDGTADPSYTFSDLANAIEKVRADFGALIDITSADLRALVPTEDKSGAAKGAAMSIAERGYLIAPIRYASRQVPPSHDQASDPRGGLEETGILIYLNTTFFEGLGADLHGYRRQHPSFPDQATSDQFFDEKEFEAYRELGFQTALRLIQDLRARTEAEQVEAAFQWMQDFLHREYGHGS